MAGFISSFTDVLGTFSEHRYLDDGVDRLNRIYAPVILVSTASILGVVQFFGDPIECTMDNRQAPTDYVKDFIKSWCWTHGTFDNVQGKNPVHINFYQWVPVVIALQAFFFQLPYMFWSNMAVAGGMNLAHVLRGADKLCEVGIDAEEHGRDVICADTCHIIDAYFKRNLILGKRSWKKKSLFNLTLSFFVAKLLYVFNIVAQLFVVNAFLQGQRANGGGMEAGSGAEGPQHADAHENVIQYAVRAMKGLVFEGQWKNSWRFPMLAMCRYYSEGRLAFGCQNPELDPNGRKRCPYDGEVLCTLPLNLYNDKVFAVMTLLMIILLVANIAVCVGWMVSVFMPSTRRSLILKILVRQNMEDRTAVRRFMESYLRTDGILVVKLIRNNCGVNSTSEVVECLFTCFQKLEQKRRHVEDEKDAGRDDRFDAGVEYPLRSSAPRLPQPQQQQQQRQQQQQHIPNLKMLPQSDPYYYSNDSQPPSIHGGLSPSTSGLRSRFHEPQSSQTGIDKTHLVESTSV